MELNFCPNFWTNRFYNKKEAKKYKFVIGSLFKMKKISLPVDVRRSKTPLLKPLVINVCIYFFKFS